QVPVVACEDTRRTGQLFKLLNIPNHPKFVSVRDWNEAKMVSLLLGYLVHGDAALVSDAGTPLISDPGYKVVSVVRAAGFVVVPIPGASAVTSALSVAGLPTDKFMFLGFWNSKYEILPNTTTIIYESPVRTRETIEEIKKRYPDADVIVARELTKIYEYIGPDDGVYKGEITIVVNYARSSGMGQGF
ncbi:MAG: ribosomal RNA small subunit methyltransferase I, partial [Patescibacteria group bacterium]